MNTLEIAPSCRGKHDLQLEKEMNTILIDKNINAYAGFERRRGKICLVVYKENDIETAKKELLLKHPDFEFSYENPAHGETRFLYFKEKI